VAAFKRASAPVPGRLCAHFNEGVLFSMIKRFQRFALTATAGLLCFAPAMFAQKAGYTPAKTWYDQPDLQGIWVPAKPIDDLQKGGYIKDPPNGKIPYIQGAAATRNQNAKNAKSADLVNRCYFPGLPRLMYMGYPFQIFETKNYVSIVSEYAHTYRMVYLDGSPHLDLPDLWLGDARGKWDGNSLVTDVTNFNDRTWLDKAGDYHSNQLHLTERFTRTGPNSLLYEATISDPKVFTKDWKIAVPMTLKTGPTTRLMEFECQDQAFGEK
jgi:hypothetical protein